MSKAKMTKSDLLALEKVERDRLRIYTRSIFEYFDARIFGQHFPENPFLAMDQLDELLERDRQRERDGFPRKIQVGKIIKPGGGSGNDSVIVVPHTEEDKFRYDDSFEDKEIGGSGDQKEGEVIGERPIDEEGQGQGEHSNTGGDSPGEHGIEKRSYELGKILSDDLELPNLVEKNKKFYSYKSTYEMTDINKGSGQILDKLRTMTNIVKDNIALGRLHASNIKPENFLVNPKSKVYKVLSEERIYESKAVVFFLRDYSASMTGPPTDVVCAIHMMLYSCLVYLYDEQVISRFILHDTEAKEASDFNEYYNASVAGGTQVSSAYELVNKIVEDEGLEKDYNIYIFHGTDGDDWDQKGEYAIPEIQKAMDYANRIGISIARNVYSSGVTEIEIYLAESGLLEKNDELLMEAFDANEVSEEMIRNHIRKILSP